MPNLYVMVYNYYQQCSIYLLGEQKSCMGLHVQWARCQANERHTSNDESPR